jgi:TonB family protein
LALKSVHEASGGSAGDFPCGRIARRKAGVANESSTHKVEKGVGSGLDEKAINCVRQWQFEPATRDRVPVSAPVHIEITFRLPH